MSDSNPTTPRRMLFILPTLFTVLNLFLGYFAMARAAKGEVGLAALIIIVSAVFDKADGLIARTTKTESDFGRELDSLADIVSFGVAPAIVAFAWGLDALGRLGWGVTFLFVTCGALRLARFNVQSAVTDPRYFTGLPIPMAAAVPMTLIFAHAQVHPDAPLLEKGPLTWAFLALMTSIALLMVSSVRYLSFKNLGPVRAHRALLVLGIATALVAILTWPEIILPALALTYAGHGPVLWVLHRLAPPGPPSAPHPSPDAAS